MLSGARFVASRISWSTRRGYQSGAAGIYGHADPGALERLRRESEADVVVDHDARNASPNLHRLVSAFRSCGHKYARTNPVPMAHQTPSSSSDAAELQAARYGFGGGDPLPTDHPADHPLSAMIDGGGATVADLVTALDRTYCGTLSAEFDAVQSELEREWLWKRYETLVAESLTAEQKKGLAEEMIRSQNFDNFVAVKFASVKRYGGEGAESMMGVFLEMVESAGKHGIKEYIFGNAHRGRLNLMTGLFRYPAVELFRKMRGLPEFPSEQKGAGDVISHLTVSVDLPTSGGGTVHCTMLPNPSHLEAVNPVAAGKTRARYMSAGSADYGTDGEVIGGVSVCVQVHGDAAFIGQGVNQETLQMSQLPHYSVGGALHVVINNQVGFTTPQDRAKTGHHSTDLAKMVGCPVIHVNGDSPEDVVKATQFCLEYQRKFRRDVFLDLVCYRRHGHNELDDPTFTNPLLYKAIRATKTTPDAYADKMIGEGVMTKEEVSSVINDHTAYLNEQLSMVDSYTPKKRWLNGPGGWSGMRQARSSVERWETGAPIDLLKYVGSKSVARPDNFSLHSHLDKIHVGARMKKLQEGDSIDWGFAEALSIGTLLRQGFNVRISGQDVGRATFAHRHAMLVDQDTNENFVPLNGMAEEIQGCGKLEMANSHLSEEAVMGFEYGMSVESPSNLIIWEAQFGDFFNTAQVILDTYVSCGESKWGINSALTILLPHGMDGAGPEHSSCRIERFLQMTDSKETSVDGDDVNWQVAFPSTSAQYFHLLRRQMLRDFRKPLVVVAPKILLRLAAASSPLSEMASGSHFRPVITSLSVGTKSPEEVERVVFVTGKHYYALARHAEESGLSGVAFVRLEQLCPFPTKELQEAVAPFKRAKKFVWSQEEHRNMGAWQFVSPRFRNLVGRNLSYCGRSELCQPAAGVGKVHQAEAKLVVEEPFQV